MPHSITYLWQDIESKDIQVKFGEHFAKGDLDAEGIEAAARSRIREDLGTSRYKLDTGQVVVHKVWDVSDYARFHGKFKPHAHIDDHIRKECLHGNIKGTEWHRMNPEDVIYEVSRELDKISGKHRRECELTPWQYDGVVEIREASKKSNAVILADWAARFGKTITMMATFKESDHRILVVSSYVKTVLQSFKKEIGCWTQFSDMVFVDSGEKGYENEIAKALSEGKRVVVYLSLCKGSLRQERIDTLFHPKLPVMLVIDEADFGSHKPAQVGPLKEAIARNKKNLVVIMTGTNADRAASSWKVTHYSCVTYPEMICCKREFNGKEG